MLAEGIRRIYMGTWWSALLGLRAGMPKFSRSYVELMSAASTALAVLNHLSTWEAAARTVAERCATGIDWECRRLRLGLTLEGERVAGCEASNPPHLPLSLRVSHAPRGLGRQAAAPEKFLHHSRPRSLAWARHCRAQAPLSFAPVAASLKAPAGDNAQKAHYRAGYAMYVRPGARFAAERGPVAGGPFESWN